MGSKPKCDDVQDTFGEAAEFTDEERNAALEWRWKTCWERSSPRHPEIQDRVPEGREKHETLAKRLVEVIGWRRTIRNYREWQEMEQRNRELAREFIAWQQQQVRLEERFVRGKIMNVRR
jgi:hypothetical protein